MLAYFAVLTSRSQKSRVVWVDGAAMLAALVGFSRVYVGAYYVSDVVCGFALGGAWLSAVITGLESMRRRDKANRTGQGSSWFISRTDCGYIGYPLRRLATLRLLPKPLR